MEPSRDRRIYGVDFSGAKDAGQRIWIAGGAAVGDALRVDSCCRAAVLPGSGKERDRCLAALRSFVASEIAGVFGFDFPFGLPQDLVRQDDWSSFVLSFPSDYGAPDEFRRACREASGGQEFKRITDQESQTPFSPYNLRLFRQTYHGIRDVLHPLVRDELACVLPMQTAVPDRPWVLEICPASSLKRQGLYLSYKGNTDAHRAAREFILGRLETAGSLSIPDKSVRSAILDDLGGDALDSVVAALASFRALCHEAFPIIERRTAYAVEGYVYV